jgi:hypothetical protein
MKKVLLLVAATGAMGWAAYAYRDRILAAMLGLATRLQGLAEDPTEEELEDETQYSFTYPKKEEDLGAR